MAIDLNILAEEEEDGGALPDLNEAQANLEEEVPGRYVIQVDDLARVACHGNDQVVHSFDLNLGAFDLNLEATEEQEQLHPDNDNELQHELEALEDDLRDYGVYTDTVNVVFDREELSDSEEEEDANANPNPDANGNEENSSRELTNTQRQRIYELLLAKSKDGKLEKDTTRAVAQVFNVSIRTVQRIWKRAKLCIAHGVQVNVDSRKCYNCGRKKVVIDLSVVSAIPLRQRSTIRSLAEALGVSKSTLHRLFKEGHLRRHSNSLKPYLKEANKKERLQWCVGMLDHRTLPNDPKFIEMENIVHIDEKWFNATKKDRTFYLHPLEEEPYRPVQNKNAIEKVMFLSTVARPRYDAEGNCTFDGKIGIWPFVRKEPAQRRSRNRERGTLVTKTIKVDRDTMRSFIISKVLPAIRACWPLEDARRTIFIQQDNARTHVPIDDEQFSVAVAQMGLDIRLVNQPPNSPDMNCLDLGFFASLQSLTANRVSKNMEELIENVQKEYNDYDPKTLNRVFVTLQSCCIEVMEANGGNKYKIPHMNKARLEALGILPKALRCDRQLYEKVIQLLGN
ncbi:hypothetical protein OsJ_12237 [Oryza sativa Japonica Group]|uniref:Transposase n=2 Tax=Oryza sativa subsp. japonica TaxID=39947 RepID=A3ALS7_ORYSJ|nr:putative transposase [Oryza sativa Japonica Group]AAX95638.1 hypothetical protein [Oryza sativa Japonica Group]ABF98389.1 transposon protein, putative, Mariner sub-class [Oryza sativa Japonica Group]EAZ28266.1 hypothetical protein OsJ_12237 [Oryza sativa Japonica Group]